MAHACNPSTQEAEAEAEEGADGLCKSRPAWSTELVPGLSGLPRETCLKPKKMSIPDISPPLFFKNLKRIYCKLHVVMCLWMLVPEEVIRLRST